MAFVLDLQAKTTLHLAPQMQYSLKLLQMDHASLTELINQEAQKNPLISLEIAPYQINRFTPIDHETEAEFRDTQNEKKLYNDIYDQLPFDLSPELAEVVYLLIDSLDDSGYLNITEQEFCEREGISPAAFHNALAVLQNLEPAGIGARSLSECLLLQLRRRKDCSPLTFLIAERYLDDVAAGHLRKIAKDTNVKLERVEAAVKAIQSLSPYPMNGFDENDKSIYVVPDVMVFFEEGKLTVSIAETSPSLNREPAYEALFAQTEDLQIRTYLKQCSSSFNRLEQALTMRANTLLSITKIIAKRQEAFFRNRDAALLPLSLNDISTELNLHVSTISKAIDGKYLRCEWGVFPLRHFLIRYMQNENIGNTEAAGQDQVIHAILTLISSEDPNAPLSDQQIFEILNSRRLIDSRRSVAYYRKKAGIPTSYSRKKKQP